MNTPGCELVIRSHLRAPTRLSFRRWGLRRVQGSNVTGFTLWTTRILWTVPGRSRNGNGRHRQVWHDVTCVGCGATVQARRTLPGKPWHVRAHHLDDGALCPQQSWWDQMVLFG